MKDILRIFKKDLDKLQKYQYNITYGLDKLFNRLNKEDYYKPTEVKSVFNGNYVLYESKADKDARLSIDEYFDIIRPYLEHMMDDYKTKVNGKYSYQCKSCLFFLQMQMKLVKCIQKVII